MCVYIFIVGPAISISAFQSNGRQRSVSATEQPQQSPAVQQRCGQGSTAADAGRERERQFRGRSFIQNNRPPHIQNALD